MVIAPGMVEAVAERGRAAGDAGDLERDDLLAEHRDDRRAAGAPSAGFRSRPRRRPSASTWARGRRGRSRGSPRRARRRWRGRAFRSMANQHAVALLELVLRQAGLAQEAFERLRRRRAARALDLLAHGLGRGGRPRAISARRRGVDIGRRSPPASSAGRGQLLGEQPREIVRAPRLHPRGDFLGAGVRAGSRLHAGHCRALIAHAARSVHPRLRRRPWRGRGRGRCRPGARRPRSRRGPAAG